RDGVADTDRLQVLEAVAAVEPALPVVERFLEVGRLRGKRHHERRWHFLAPSWVVVADGGAEAAHLAGFDQGDAFTALPAYLGLQPVDDGRAADCAAHRPRGNPSTRSAMMFRWISDEPA